VKRSRLVVLALLLAAAALLAFAGMAALQGAPAVALPDDPDYRDVGRALELLRRHDPRRSSPGQARTALLTERELEVLLAQGAQRWLQASSRVSLQAAGATVQLSLHVPPNPFGRWLNIELELGETTGLPALESLRVGRLRVPAALAEAATPFVLQRLGLREQARLLVDVVQQVRFMPGQTVVRYAWPGDGSQRVMATLLPAGDLDRLRGHATLLARLAEAEPAGGEIALARLLGPVFELAARRSADGGDAAAENRAALMVLALYANGLGVEALAPAVGAWPRPRPLRLLLAGRDDSPRHFLVSAALAAEGTGALSQAIGLYKEVSDARGGSGFSFTDMATNRAGTRFGQLATEAPRRVQAAVARGVQDHDLVPRLDDLPEFIPEAEFLRRYGGVGSPGYNRLLATIDERIAALPLLH
jgi:hypothetical protein